ncbi:hypothetical protein PYCC9005_000671 [Savitreella phatthalungensis]
MEALRTLPRHPATRSIALQTVTARLHRPLTTSPPLPLPTTPTRTLPTAPESLVSAMRYMRLQPRHWAKVRVNGFSYVVTSGDTVHLPFRLVGTRVGDALRLSEVTAVGSRDFTASVVYARGVKNGPAKKVDPTVVKDAAESVEGAQYAARASLPVGLATVDAVVVEHTKEPLRYTIKKKRRQRKITAIRSKLPYTVIRITDISITPDTPAITSAQIP